MKSVTKTIFVLSVLFSFSCQNTTLTNSANNVQPNTQQNQIAFKGYELYSWRLNNGNWYYAILEGTNRIKTYQEIVAVQVSSPAEIKNKINTFAKGETIIWNNLKDQIRDLPLSLPESTIQEEIKTLCTQKGITLSIDL